MDDELEARCHAWGAAVGAAAVPRTAVPSSLLTYLATRTDDVTRAVGALAAGPVITRLWTPVVGLLAEKAGLAPCALNATLLLRYEMEAISVKILADNWAVTLSGDCASVEVKWGTQSWVTSIVGKPLSTLVEQSFLDQTLAIEDFEIAGGYTRFDCRETGQTR